MSDRCPDSDGPRSQRAKSLEPKPKETIKCLQTPDENVIVYKFGKQLIDNGWPQTNGFEMAENGGLVYIEMDGQLHYLQLSPVDPPTGTQVSADVPFVDNSEVTPTGGPVEGRQGEDEISPADHNKEPPTQSAKEELSAPATWTKSTGDKSHVCTVCGKGFNKSAYVKIHMRVHTGEKPYACHLCEARFTGRTAQQRHLLRHTGERPFKCDICGNDYVLKQDLREHRKGHGFDAEKKCVCDVCGIAFRYPFQLKIHKRPHTGEKPVECNICHTMFRTPQTLYIHKRTHTGEKPSKCLFCGKRFATTSDKNRHEMIHRNEKPFKCDLCDKHFQRRYKMESHRKVHFKETVKSANNTKDKTFQCGTCDQTFALQLSLDLHMRMVHSTEEVEQGPASETSYKNGEEKDSKSVIVKVV